jgi:HD-GYP domain-containing protein (c-di-GMP phosphodiesterase class II)
MGGVNQWNVVAVEGLQVRWVSVVQQSSESWVTEREQTFERLIEIGIALSSERNHNRLMEMILLEAKRIPNADGGTLYLYNDEGGTLSFEIMRNDTLNIKMGGTTGQVIPFPPLQIYDLETKEANYKNVATAVALSKEKSNIPDAYMAEEYDFSGTKAFDEKTGYRSTSFLTIPLLNRADDVIGIVQLINARDEAGNVVEFGHHVESIIGALASQAAVALENQLLVQQLRTLMDSFIELIAGAIDEKSAYTGGHCQRVPELIKMIARAACASDDPRFASFNLTEDQWYELHLAGWLHDCGKITTPEYVVDKAVKLETINNRIHEIRNRFEIMIREAEIGYLKECMDSDAVEREVLKRDYEERVAQLADDFEFIAEANIGGEFLDDEAIERIKRIAEMTWTRKLDRTIGLSWEEVKRLEAAQPMTAPCKEKLLENRSDHVTNEYDFGEIYNLSIRRGTLTEQERLKINDHISVTIDMLESLPFPKNLKKVPEYAGGHHEKMDGTGYPRGLTKDDMSMPARMMAIADIFEALTASDRPYKKAKKLSESLKIMMFMNKDQHIDADLFELFLTEGVWKEYAEIFLDPEQIDDVDISLYMPAGGDD